MRCKSLVLSGYLKRTGLEKKGNLKTQKGDLFYEISQKRHKYRQRAIQGLKIQCVMGQSAIHKEKISVYRKSVSSQKEHIHIWLSLFIGLENQQNTPIFLSTENIGV